VRAYAGEKIETWRLKVSHESKAVATLMPSSGA